MAKPKGSYPPSVNAIRQRLLAEEPALAAFSGGLVTAICRLAARPGLEESVAEAIRWGQELLGEPSDERLAPLTKLLLTERYSLGERPPILLTEPLGSLLEFFRGVRRVWLCRGQSLTLHDGRRLGEELLAANIPPRPFGTTNRCQSEELAEFAEEGDGVLWAASGSFRLGGFVQHYTPVELARLSGQRRLRAAVYLDAWQEPLPATSLPTFVSTPPNIGFAVGLPPETKESLDPAATERLFRWLRQR